MAALRSYPAQDVKRGPIQALLHVEVGAVFFEAVAQSKRAVGPSAVVVKATSSTGSGALTVKAWPLPPVAEVPPAVVTVTGLVVASVGTVTVMV